MMSARCTWPIMLVGVAWVGLLSCGEPAVRTTEGPEQVDDPFDRVVVTGSVVNLRGGPGTRYTVVGRVKWGDTLVVTGATTGWLRVYDQSESLFGWIFEELTDPAQDGGGENEGRGDDSR
ncbi:SH3 domain-containing protein [Candidatus Fermentibacteria bacterium]|nr:SH3 domain-containing protein [Candidatus Fermentibacteria bacterium]